MGKAHPGLHEGSGSQRGQASAVRTPGQNRERSFDASGADHEDEAELLTEAPPLPVSLKFPPSNTGCRSGETAGLKGTR